MNDEISLTQHKELLSNTSSVHEAHPFDELWSSSKGLATVAAVGTAMVAAPLMLRRGAGVDRLAAGADTAAARTLGNDVLTGTAMRMKPVSLADKLASLQAPTTRVTEAEHRAALMPKEDSSKMLI